MGLSVLLTRAPRRQRGTGLIELMTSMVLGLLVISGVASMFVGTAKSNKDLLIGVNLEQELHAIADLMLRDLRRAGAHGRPELLATGVPSPFSLGASSAHAAEAADSCIVFSYDLDQDGVLDTAAGDERFGFRLRDQRIQVRRNGLPCAADASPGWETMTDAKRIQVTALNFAVSQAAANTMRVRSVRVTLSGRSAVDAAITRTVTREVRVRNDLYAP